MRDVSGKRVIITGAAMGLGKLFAEKFAAEGANLILVDLDGETLKTTASGLLAYGVEVASYTCDLSKREEIEALGEKVHAEVGKVDVVVNNAGVVFGGPFLDVDVEKHALTIDVNVLGVMWMTRAFLPDMIEKGRGHFLNLASASGLMGLPRGASYAASKWACIGFSESIRLEMAEMGLRDIKVTVIAPSYINTGMFDGVKAPFLTPLLEPDRLVDIAYEAFKKDKILVYEPFMVKLTPTLKALLPPPVFDFVGKMFGVTRSMHEWHGRKD